MESLSSRIMQVYRKLAQDEDPMDLFQMIRSTLSSMQIANMLQNNKTELTQLTDSKGRRLFKVLFRRDAAITDNNIERMRREENEFEKMEWTAQGIALYIWGEYTPPEGEEEAI